MAYWLVEWTDSVVHEEDSSGVPCVHVHSNVPQIQHGSELKKMNQLCARPTEVEMFFSQLVLVSSLVLIEAPPEGTVDEACRLSTSLRRIEYT